MSLSSNLSKKRYIQIKIKFLNVGLHVNFHMMELKFLLDWLKIRTKIIKYITKGPLIPQWNSYDS